MTIIQTAIAIAVAVAGTAATTAFAIHASAPLPVACQDPAGSSLARKLNPPALPMTGNPTLEFK